MVFTYLNPCRSGVSSEKNTMFSQGCTVSQRNYTFALARVLDLTAVSYCAEILPFIPLYQSPGLSSLNITLSVMGVVWSTLRILHFFPVSYSQFSPKKEMQELLLIII